VRRSFGDSGPTSECTVSETPPPGCTLELIDARRTAIEKPVVYPVMVTNNCDPPLQPSGAEAVAVVAAPRFTRQQEGGPRG
jgi:hypothetical protein